jgi:hypothetical protein
MHKFVLAVLLIGGVPCATGGQGVRVGGALGVVKPEGLGLGVLVDLDLRLHVLPAVDATVGLGGWTVSEVDTVTVETGPGIFAQQALTYPVTDATLSAGLLYAHRVGRRYQLFAGGGAGFHYLISDLHSLAIEGGSELRPGGYGVVGLERSVTARLGIQTSARIDLLREISHVRIGLGVRYRL